MPEIIVAGGGHGGIAAGAILAKYGYSVTVYEKNKQEDMGYDWPDVFDKRGLFRCGMKMPEKGDYTLKRDMTFVSPDLLHTLKQHTPEDQLELVMERKTLYRQLIAYALDCGVKFEFETTVISPKMLGSRVVGIVTDKGEALGDLVIDAAGCMSPLRTNLPEYLGIKKYPDEYENFYVYRGFFDRIGEKHEDSFRVHLLFDGVMGINWVATENDSVDVLIGRFQPFSQRDVDSVLCSLKKCNTELGDTLLRGGGFCSIPVRQTLPVMVADGYAAIGDSAFMTVPLIGSGIANSLKAAEMLAFAVASDKNNAFTAETLYLYQKRFFAELGSGLSTIACIKLMLTRLTPEEVDFLFSEGILNDDDVTMGADTLSVLKMTGGLNSDGIKAKLSGMAKNKELLKKATAMITQIGEAIAICAAMPKVYNRAALLKWAKHYETVFKR